ncbi:MAG: DNA polymerase III subunit gamma/tau, partial [Chloroflexi bacterium]|nr:DNA polymerase III subunit gamma/tau [Chloroflexota bacterium]
MATQALYRRWRSQTFAEIIGQEHVTQTLLNALRAGRIAHAYLFAGPRGTGKTTTARVLAKAVNCLDPQNGEPCNRCAICRSLNEARSLDLLEIDAASNTGVDNIRDLREKIAFSPSECRYKVYVVDEVHMLSSGAFNALLKTLEEPPPHAIFVL